MKEQHTLNKVFQLVQKGLYIFGFMARVNYTISVMPQVLEYLPLVVSLLPVVEKQSAPNSRIVVCFQRVCEMF